MNQTANDFISMNTNVAPLSDWFVHSVNRAVDRADIAPNIPELTQGIVQELADYRIKHQIQNAVIGISGGLDSAVTLNLLVQAGWNVTPLILPIHQNPAEIGRAFSVCEKLNLVPKFVDLSAAFDQLIRYPVFTDVDVPAPPTMQVLQPDAKSRELHQARVRGGNIRARLRMITLYHTASRVSGLVVSTDNLSELVAGFWTLHGDVGDLAPIQSLTKSWEVPGMAKLLQVPDSVISATPTDGLGISTGDQAQLGYSYAQADLVTLDLMHNQLDITGATPEDLSIITAVKNRIQNTAFKRNNPAFCAHPDCGNWRYQQLAQVERNLISNTITQ